MVKMSYSIAMIPGTCAGCIILQSRSPLHKFAGVSYSNSLSLQCSIHFSPKLVQFRTNRCNSMSYNKNLRGGIPSKNISRVHQILISKSTFGSKSFFGFNDHRTDDLNGSSRWGKVRLIHASTQGFDQDSQNEGSSEPSLIQSPSGKKEERNPKLSAHVDEDDRPSTSGRPEPSVGPPEQGWWRHPKWIWNSIWSWKGAPAVQAHEVGALLLQLSVVVLLMRLLRPGVPFPGRSSPLKSESSSSAYVSVPFSEFLSRINQNDVESVEIDGFHLTYSLRPSGRQARPEKEVQIQVGDGLEYETSRTKGVEVPATAQSSSPSRRIVYTTTRPFDISTPYEQLQENGVVFGAPDKRPVKLVNTLFIFLLYVGLIGGLLSRFSLKLPQRSTTGRMRNRKGLLSGGGKDQGVGGPIMFADVAGVDEAKEELEEIVEFLKHPERYSRLGARPPRGILLTLLAKAVAGEADVPFISCSASEFVELYVGMGASRVRDLFARAKKEAPSIVFIDEIDAVAKGRDGRLRSVGNDEREQTLNQLLTELDGFESSSTVIVLGATNRADVLDPALRRPGRFDRIVTVEPPDRQGREEILTVHVTKKQLPLAPDVNLNVIAAATAGFTGADLANLVNEAALLAGRASKLEVGNSEFSQAVERSIAGIEKKRSTLHGSEKGVVARHEAGHAVVGTAVAKFIPGLTRVQKLSILPRTGGALGFTYIPPGAEDRNLLFVDELRGRLVTLLGGRAAEEVVYHGRVSTGSLDDIKRATDLAYKAVAEYGLSPIIGPISLATLSGGGLDDTGSSFSWGKDQGHMADMVQKEVRSLMNSALEMALLVIRSNPTVLEGLGAQLEAEERLEGDPLEEWLNAVHAPIELAAFFRGTN
uniref:AAA+ ATPase domain-containing protein n=1 Tax=Physcomitrium patens TaxID=3218 RepID=A0A7I4CH08_PHYPA